MADQSPEPRAESSTQPETAEPAAPSAEEAIDNAARAAETLQADVGHPVVATSTPQTLDLPDLGGNGVVTGPAGLELLNDVDLAVTIELGRTKMYIEDVLHLNEHSVVELDKAAGDPVDIYVNERHVARGEVLVLDENFCVRVTEIMEPLTQQTDT